MGSDAKYDYSFKKLTGSTNYKQWTRDMSFALEEAKLWDHVLGTAIPPPTLVATVMIYLETSHRDTRNEYNKDKEGKRQSTTRTCPYISSTALVPMWYSRHGTF